jgi:hypothetical protein
MHSEKFRKALLFEKSSKNFCPWGCAPGAKSFWFFFQKELFLSTVRHGEPHVPLETNPAIPASRILGLRRHGLPI